MNRRLIACLLAMTFGVGSAAIADPIELAANDEVVVDGLSLIYDPDTGDLSASAPDGSMLTALEIRSPNDLFLGGGCDGLSGPFDVCTEDKVFFLVTGGFAAHDFGTILPTDLTPDDLLGDLLVDGASNGGGFNTGTGVYIVHPAVGIPEPVGLSLFGLGIALVTTRFRR